VPDQADAVQQLFLGSEVHVDAGGREAGTRRDVAGRRAVIAACRELVGRGDHDAPHDGRLDLRPGLVEIPDRRALGGSPLRHASPHGVAVIGGPSVTWERTLTPCHTVDLVSKRSVTYAASA